MDNINSRKARDRISRLENRLTYLINKTYRNYFEEAEISALQWAVPLLLDLVDAEFGTIPPGRNLMGANKALIKRQVFKRDGPVCFVCHKDMPLRDRTLEHIIPLIRGGTDDLDNLALTHEKCNSLKANLLMQELEELND